MRGKRFFEPDDEPEIYELISWDLCGATRPMPPKGNFPASRKNKL